MAASREADLWSAVLYAGPGAVLSHATAAQWRGLIDRASSAIEASTPRCKIRSIDQLVDVHSERHLASSHGASAGRSRFLS